eukprot:jgi/Phyca11/113720/e_gw1.24.401.1
MAACASKEAAVQWCLKVGLLPRSRPCPKCGEAMRLSPNGKRLRCCRASCRLERTYKKRSFFDLKLQVAVLLLCFSKQEKSTHTHAPQLSLKSSHTLADWFSFCRATCALKMLRCPIQVGGPGHVVEIDETSINKKFENNVGARDPDYCLFGGVDRTTNIVFASIVENNRTKARLSAEMRNHNIENNPYLAGMDYSHQWVNHSTSFVNPDYGVHTQRTEGVWEVRIKQRLKVNPNLLYQRLIYVLTLYVQGFGGYPRHLIHGYIDECLWRVWFFSPKRSATVHERPSRGH